MARALNPDRTPAPTDRTPMARTRVGNPPGGGTRRQGPMTEGW